MTLLLFDEHVYLDAQGLGLSSDSIQISLLFTSSGGKTLHRLDVFMSWLCGYLGKPERITKSPCIRCGDFPRINNDRGDCSSGTIAASMSCRLHSSIRPLWPSSHFPIGTSRGRCYYKPAFTSSSTSLARSVVIRCHTNSIPALRSRCPQIRVRAFRCTEILTRTPIQQETPFTSVITKTQNTNKRRATCPPSGSSSRCSYASSTQQQPLPMAATARSPP